VSAQAEQASVALSCLPPSTPCWVYADAQRLHQCLVNLLTNAIKYNRPGGRASLEITGNDQEVTIAIIDNGPGMDTLQRQHLFEPFNRLGKHSDTTPGTGLGLVITRQLVEAMNGQLRVDSEPGHGSCFSIALPGAPRVTAAHE
jgi:signal transduction histidine kinase